MGPTEFIAAGVLAVSMSIPVTLYLDGEASKTVGSEYIFVSECSGKKSQGGPCIISKETGKGVGVLTESKLHKR